MEMERLIGVLIESNNASLRDLQGELSDGINVIQGVNKLCEVLKAEQAEHAEALKELGACTNRGRAISPKRILESANINKVTEENDLLIQHKNDLEKQLKAEMEQNENLRDTMRDMVEDYSRQLEIRDNTIRQMQQNEANQQNEMSHLIFKENEALKQENRMLRDKIILLDEEINRMTQCGVTEPNFRA